MQFIGNTLSNSICCFSTVNTRCANQEDFQRLISGRRSIRRAGQYTAKGTIPADQGHHPEISTELTACKSDSRIGNS
jgi:hypothetical protein